MPALTGSTQEVQLTSLIIRELATIRYKDKEFEKAKSNISKNYSLKRLEGIHRKYMKKPQKLKEKLREMAEEFVRDYTTFKQKFTDLFTTIVQTIDVSGRELTVELHKVDALVDHIRSRISASPAQFYFPEGARKDFAEEFKKAVDALAAQLKIEYAQYQGAMRGRRVATGLFSKLVRSQSAARTGARKAKALLEEAENVQKIAQEIEEELGGSIRQDFIALLLQYVVALEKTDKSLKQIKKDLVIIMDNVWDELQDVLPDIAKFIVVVENDPNVKPEIEKARAEFDKQLRKVVALIRHEERWPRFDMTIAMNLKQKERELISALSGVNIRHVNARAQNILHQERSAFA